jgi:UDP:flavonoid glycosyltransferase YjiC (YdhE family)
MKTILFVVGYALGHVGRALIIARALRASKPDIRIVFAHISPGHGDLLLRPEFESISISSQDGGGECFADALEQVLQTVDPTLICLDLSPVPWLYLVRFPETPKAYVTNYFLSPIFAAETGQVRHFKINSTKVNHGRRQRGLPELHDAKALYHADAVLFCDPARLFAGDLVLAEPYHFVGPCIWQPSGSLPSVLHARHRLLAVALGSTGTKPISAEMVEGFRSALDCDASVWLTTNNSGFQPGRYDLLYSGVPLSPILEKSPLAITQGGVGSTYAALTHRVPVAVWPSHHNHDIMAEVLAEAGVGASITKLAALGPGDLEERVRAMKNACERLELGSPDSHPARAAEILLSMQ